MKKDNDDRCLFTYPNPKDPKYWLVPHLCPHHKGEHCIFNGGGPADYCTFTGDKGLMAFIKPTEN